MRDPLAITPASMKRLFVDSPYSRQMADSTIHMLRIQNERAARIYEMELVPHVGQAQLPAAWPCWQVQPQPQASVYGHIWSAPTIPNKTSALWHGQGGFMKSEARYEKTRGALLAVEEGLHFRTVDFNGPLHSLSLPLSGASFLVVFLSNLLTMRKWSHDVNCRQCVQRRLKAAFSLGGMVVETHPEVSGDGRFTGKLTTCGGFDD